MSWASAYAPPGSLICFRTPPTWSPWRSLIGDRDEGAPEVLRHTAVTLGPLMVDVAGLELTPEDRDVLRHPLVGSVILFTRNFRESEQLARLVADIHAVRSPALIVGVDHEGGRVQRFRREGFSVLPTARRIG